MPSMPRADGDVSGLVGDLVALADLDPDRVQEDHGVERVQRATLPVHDRLAHRVGDLRDRRTGQVHPQRLTQMVGDVAHFSSHRRTG